MENYISKADRRLMASPYYIQFKSAENAPVYDSDYGYVRKGTYKVEDEFEEPVKEAEAPKCQEKTCDCKSKKKNGGYIAAGIINLFAIVAFIAVLAVGYFKILPEYTMIFAGADISNFVIKLIETDVSGFETASLIMFYATTCTPLLAVVLAVLDVILCIIGLATKGKVKAMGVISLLALVAWLACGVLIFFAAGVAQDSESIINYINPMVNNGVVYGYYISALLLLIATITGFCCMSKKK